MHIALVGKKSPFCGNVTYCREIARQLKNRAHQVSFYHFARPRERLPNWGEAYVSALPYLYKSQIYTVQSLGSKRILETSLRSCKPDLVHASLTLSFLDFRLPNICRQHGLPVIATFHPPFDSKLRGVTARLQSAVYRLYSPSLAHYDQVIVFSETQKDVLVKMGVPSRKLHVIPNGVDHLKYTPAGYPAKRQNPKVTLFVYQGRIAPEKNIKALLEAWKGANMGDSCKLLIVGDGPSKPSLEASYSDKLGIEWLGSIRDESSRIRILQSADVFVLPSLVEGLSLSLLEAMACGLACVATDAGADGEVLDQGAGIVVDTRQVTEQLLTLLPRLRDQPALVSSLGRKARERVLHRYTMSSSFNALEALYRSLASANLDLSRLDADR